jgi:hypothetical protein
VCAPYLRHLLSLLWLFYTRAHGTALPPARPPGVCICNTREKRKETRPRWLFSSFSSSRRRRRLLL